MNMIRRNRLASALRALALLMASALLTPASSNGAGSDLDLLGQQTPRAVTCGDILFELKNSGALRFPSWHFRSKEAVGPEDSYLVCGQYMNLEGDVVGWLCATETYTPIGVTSGTHMCDTVSKLMNGEY